MRDKLIRGDGVLCVWGVGFIGVTTMSYFANHGVQAVGIDVDRSKVDLLNRGETPIPELAHWLRASGCQPVVAGKMSAYSSWESISPSTREKVVLHLVAVPTEDKGEPWYEPLWAVLDLIEKLDAPAVIESTLSPCVIPEIKRRYSSLRFIISPRRDWFGTPERNLKTIVRVAGGDDEELVDQVIPVLEIVTKKVSRASNALTACMVKSVENTIRQICIAFANELSGMWAGELDVKEVLELASTKWNIPYYRPSCGIGGYCLPLAPKYVREKAPKGSKALTEAAISHMPDYTNSVALWLMQQGNSFHIVGVEYTPDVAVYKESPFVSIANRIAAEGYPVVAEAEYRPREEVAELSSDVGVGVFPDEIGQHEVLVIGCGHQRYRTCSWNDLLQSYEASAKKLKLVVDNDGVFERFRESFWSLCIRYIVPGELGWLAE